MLRSGVPRGPPPAPSISNLVSMPVRFNLAGMARSSVGSTSDAWSVSMGSPLGSTTSGILPGRTWIFTHSRWTSTRATRLWRACRFSGGRRFGQHLADPQPV
jgi:hypothetical protein